MKITVCYFGFYSPDESRSRVLINGLKENGVEVLNCNVRARGIFNMGQYFDLIKKHWKIRKQYNVMIIGYPPHHTVILAKFLTRKPIIFDAAVSVYETLIIDRKSVKPRSIKALAYWLIDFISMHLADLVICGTFAHIKYVSKKFYIRQEKFRRVLIGAPNDIFYPLSNNNNTADFTVIFFGKIVSLHGVEYIIEAAKILESHAITFFIIGGGSEKEKMVSRAREVEAKNITFVDALPQDLLAKEVAKADVCLGIFSESPKAQRAIPSKVFECAAMKKPIITADTPGTRELFDDNDMMLVEASNANDLANAILSLKRDPQKRYMLANNAYDKFVKFATPKVIGGELKNIIYSLVPHP